MPEDHGRLTDSLFQHSPGQFQRLGRPGQDDRNYYAANRIPGGFGNVARPPTPGIVPPAQIQRPLYPLSSPQQIVNQFGTQQRYAEDRRWAPSRQVDPDLPSYSRTRSAR
jgi:hypothetical protein